MTLKREKNKETITLEIKEYKNKYRLAAEEIYADLGINNYQNVYHCMTRFRAKIIDKNLVHIDALKKIPLVKKVLWVGDELQVVIGGEVSKVTDEFKQYEEDILKPVKTSKNEIIVKKTLWQKFLGFLSGVMSPCIPVLMIVGLIGGIYALLTLPQGHNLLQTSYTTINEKGETVSIAISLTNLNHFDIWSSLMFLLNKVILGGLGVFFIFNTTKYFNGNVLFGLVVGLTLMSRGFFPGDGYGIPFSEAGFGDWTSAQGKTGFLLFKIGEYPILVCGYEGAIIPYVVAGLLVTYVDKWIKTWMPSTVDIVFRPLLVYLLSIFALWFLLAPFAGMFESFLGFAFQSIGTIPYGFGVGILAFCFQFIVLVGANWVVSMPFMAEFTQNHASAAYNAFPIATWAQVGAVIGVAIMTKNMTLKKVAWGTVPGGLFAVTEPILYAVNVPKVKPFLFGCIGAGVAGFVSGLLNVELVRMSPFGILIFLGYESTAKGIGFGMLPHLIAVVISLGLVLAFYTERKNELSYFKKGINKLTKFVSGDKKIINKDFEIYATEIKKMKNDYKKMDKYYSEISKQEQHLMNIENQESKQRQKMYKELVWLKSKIMKKSSNELLNKFNKLNDKYATYNLDQQKNEIQKKLTNIINSNEKMFSKFTTEKEDIYYKTLKEIENHQTNENATNMLVVQNMMWNALNAVEIGYGIEDAKPIKYKKEVQ